MVDPELAQVVDHRVERRRVAVDVGQDRQSRHRAAIASRVVTPPASLTRDAGEEADWRGVSDP
jgi:hypothetical protein